MAVLMTTLRYGRANAGEVRLAKRSFSKNFTGYEAHRRRVAVLKVRSADLFFWCQELSRFRQPDQYGISPNFSTPKGRSDTPFDTQSVYRKKPL